MNEFEQSDLEKETSDSRNTFYQIAIRYKEKENAFMRNCKYGLFSLVFVINLGGRMTDLFSRTKEDRQGHGSLTEIITM